MRVTLRVRIVITFLVVTAIVGGVSYYQIASVNTINNTFLDLIDNDFAQIDALEKIKISLARIENKVQQPNAKTEALELTNDIQDHIKLLRDHSSTGQTAAVDPVTVNQINATLDDVVRRIDDLYAVTAATQLSARQAELTKSRAQLTTLVDAALDEATKRVALENGEATAIVNQTVNTTRLTAILAALTAILLGLIVAASISRRVKKLGQAAQAIANGDFSETITIGTTDEIGDLARAFNQMSARLRESYRRLAVEAQRDSAMMQNMGEGLIAIDDQGNIVLLNHVAATLLEIDSNDDVGGASIYNTFRILDHDNNVMPPEQTPMYAALAHAAKVSDVFSLPRKDGRKILANVNASPIILDQKVVGAVLVLRDVTKEREVDRMKTEFISLASHQLRTPLSAIKWFSEMLASGDAGKLGDEQADFVKNISDSTERMIQLVNALLNISRIESGRIMVTPQPTDLKDLVSGIVNDLKGKTAEKQQSLVISVHQDLPKISLDPRLIGQVYLNLLTNAIKYTPKGGEISVFISKKDDMAISQVSDNGYGIPKEQQGRVFQKFFRASNAVQVETDGTGLGLYLIKSIIESSGGQIWFESAEGKGTTFWFSIPLSGMKAKKGEVTLDM